MGGPNAPTTTGNNGEPHPPPQGTIAKLMTDILNDTFYNIIYDIVAKAHRDEKIARTRSAVIMVRQKAEEEMARKRESEVNNKMAKPGETQTSIDKLENQIKVETNGAVFDRGKVYLKGNPLVTTKEIICPYCRLPRLLYPTAGVGARPPPDPFREYCQNHPLIIKAGHDVHGNPFATDKLNSKKKKNSNNTSTNTPVSSPPSTPDVSASGSIKQTAPEKVSFPTIKCPNCPRYFVVTRVAQHLDRCLGLSGRNAGRNRTPLETNGTTNNSSSFSAPTTLPKRPRPDDDNIATATLQKKKKPNTPKKLMLQKLPSKLKNGTTADMAAAREEGTELSKAHSEDGEVKLEDD